MATWAASQVGVRTAFASVFNTGEGVAVGVANANALWYSHVDTGNVEGLVIQSSARATLTTQQVSK